MLTIYTPCNQILVLQDDRFVEGHYRRYWPTNPAARRAMATCGDVDPAAFVGEVVAPVAVPEVEVVLPVVFAVAEPLLQ